MVFPIASIDGLSESTKVSEVIGFAYLGDLVLNPGQKSIVELVGVARLPIGLMQLVD